MMDYEGWAEVAVPLFHQILLEGEFATMGKLHYLGLFTFTELEQGNNFTLVLKVELQNREMLHGMFTKFL